MKRIVFTAVLLTFSSIASAADFVGHRAIYEISFVSARPESQIVDANGKWVSELRGDACSGYNVSYRFVTNFEFEGSSPSLVDTRFKSFESAEGEAFDFENSTFRNNNLSEDIKGIAARKNGEVAVKLSKPEPTDITFSNDVLFPIQHFTKLIDSVVAGETLINSTVYEGINGAKEPFDSTAIVLSEGKVEEVDSDVPYKVLEEQKVRRWSIKISFFKTSAQGDAKPQWQNTFTVYENGVARDFTFDYGHVVLKAKLTGLELFDKSDC